MKLQYLRYFVTLAQTLNFSQTAMIHYVSQTTISQQIKELENELGCNLFIRTKRHVELTPVGKVFLNDAEKILDLLDNAERKVQMFESQESLSLNIAITYSITPGYIVPLIEAFKSANPEIALNCYYCQQSDIYSNLISSDIDIAIFLKPNDFKHPDTIEIEMDHLRKYVITSNKSSLAQYNQILHSQLQDECLIESRDLLFPNSADLASEDLDVNAKDPLTKQNTIMVDNLSELLLTLALNKGYAIILEPMIQLLSPKLNLAMIPLVDDTVPLIMSYQKERKDPAIIRFIDYICSTVNQ